MHRLLQWLVLVLLSSASLASAQEMTEGRLMRFPDVYKDQIVFSYGGDLWLGSTSGGVARRITSHPGLELFPKFSPTASGSLSPASTTAISTFTSFPPKAASRSN